MSFFSGGGQPVLRFHGRQVGLLLVGVQLLESFVGLIVENDQVPVANVEAAQMVASVLRVEDVLVNDERRSSCVGCVSAVVTSKKLVEFFPSDVELLINQGEEETMKVEFTV